MTVAAAQLALDMPDELDDLDLAAADENARSLECVVAQLRAAAAVPVSCCCIGGPLPLLDEYDELRCMRCGRGVGE